MLALWIMEMFLFTAGLVTLGIITGVLFYGTMRKYILMKKNQNCDENIYYVLDNQVYEST